MSNHPRKRAVVNKFEYIKMLTKISLSLRAKNDFRLFFFFFLADF